MPIVFARPYAWTPLGTGPLRIFSKSWQLGIIIRNTSPATFDPPDEIIAPSRSQEYNTELEIYVKPLEDAPAEIGVSAILPPRGSTPNIPQESEGDLNASAFLLPSMIVPPNITGSPTIGKDLSIDLGTWTNSPKHYMYQVLRDGTPISGAGGIVTLSRITYTVVSADRGTALTVSAAAANDYGVGGPITSLGMKII